MSETIGELDLVERFLEELELVPIVPGTRGLVPVENGELHRSSLSHVNHVHETARRTTH